MQDIFTFDAAARIRSAERLTPHKLSIMCFAYEYIQVLRKNRSTIKWKSESTEVPILTDKERRVFMCVLLDLLQCPDIGLRVFRSHIDGVVNSYIVDAVYMRLSDVANQGEKPLQDFMEQIIGPVVAGFDSYSEEEEIRRDGVMGVYFRRMMIAYHEMSFSQIVDLCHKIKDYYKAGFPPDIKQSDAISKQESSLRESSLDRLSISHLESRPESASSSTEGLDTLNIFSKRQAEYFMARQSLMLDHNPSETLPPDQLQVKLKDILTANPDVAEAHFLSYLNNLRVKEYCMALHSIHHYFDLKASAPIEGPAAKKRPVQVQQHTEVAMRYAALNLASLQFRFGNKDECKAALKEAIVLAQEANDQVCLQHALVWLNLLGGKHTSVSQLERSIKKTIDLNLSTLTVYGLNNLDKAFGMGKETPMKVIHYFTQSNLINCMNSSYGMMASGCAQRAAIWHHYGKRELSCLDSHIVLNLDTNINGTFYNGQPVCIALCNLAQLHADLGDYASASEILSQAKQQFPSGFGHPEEWQICEQRIAFTRAVHNGRFSDAEQALSTLQALDVEEAKIRQVILLRERRQMVDAFQSVNKLVLECDQEKSPHYADFKCRVLLELSNLYMSSGEATTATLHVTECMALAAEHHLELLEAVATAHLAYIQLVMNLPAQALRLLESRLLRILSHAGSFDKARVLHLYARCRVAAAKSVSTTLPQQMRKELESAIRIMMTVIQLYHTLESHLREKDAIHFLAILHDALFSLYQSHHQSSFGGIGKEGVEGERDKHRDERNRCARQFKVLDKLYPTLGTKPVCVL